MKKHIVIIIVLLLIPTTSNALDWVPFTVTRHVDTTSFTATDFDNEMNVANDHL